MDRGQGQRSRGSGSKVMLPKVTLKVMMMAMGSHQRQVTAFSPPVQFAKWVSLGVVFLLYVGMKKKLRKYMYY